MTLLNLQNMKCFRPECLNPVPSGRSDKKYCCEKCGWIHRNQMAKIRNADFIQKMKIIKKNDRILSLFYNSKTVFPMDMEILLQLGFNPDIYISMDLMDKYTIECKMAEFSFIQQKNEKSSKVITIKKL